MRQIIKTKQIIFSGIQPTGKVHLGNYLGALKNWVGLQNKYRDTQTDIFYCIVDHHALTDKYKTDHDIQFEQTLKMQSLELYATLLAIGLDPKRNTIFLQSQVPQHCELAWILSCIAPMNWLNTMTQFKDKKTKSSSLGLYSYPVLMAADILLYNANLVPVGEDQRQHLELAKDYAVRFNSLFSGNNKKDEINIPSYIKSEIPRVMSLRDGNKKMSKSDLSDASRINLEDDPQVIYDKIIKAKTDSIASIKYSDQRPEVSNLLRIFSSISDKSITDIENQFSKKSMKEFKEALSEELTKKIYPIGVKVKHLLEDREALIQSLKEGGQKARTVADQNLIKIKQSMGYLVI